MQFSENTTLIKLNIDTKSKDLALKPSSDDGVEETLLSIPNRTVKLYSANGTAREAVWESRTSLGLYGFIAQLVEQWIEDPRVLGSIPSEATKKRTNLC